MKQLFKLVFITALATTLRFFAFFLLLPSGMIVTVIATTELLFAVVVAVVICAMVIGLWGLADWLESPTKPRITG